MKKTIAFLLTGLFALGSLAAAPAIGERAPAFTLKDSNGKEHSLSDFKGKFVVLEWLNHDCPFVRKFYDGGDMQGLQEKYTGKGVVWLVINSSAPGEQGHLTPEAANRISAEKKAKHTALLLDHDGKVGRAYDARVTPHMFVINPEGILIYNGAIDSIRSARRADIPNAENYVVSALTSAMKGEPVATPLTRPYGCSVKYRN